MDLDDPKTMSALRDFVAAATALDDTGREGDPRMLLDLAETKLIASMRLRKALVAQGWTPPAKKPAVPQVRPAQQPV